MPEADVEPALTVSPAERVQLRASWPDCREPEGCGGSEPYVYFDPLNRQLMERREALRVAWFATDGAFEHERTGRSADEADDTMTENVWRAPDSDAEVRLWVVLRDDRGGVGWGSYRLQVQ